MYICFSVGIDCWIIWQIEAQLNKYMFQIEIEIYV